MSIGEKLSPVLEEIESTLWEFEANQQEPPQYTDNGFRAVMKIFMTALMDKMWLLQDNENIPQELREDMAVEAGKAVRELVKTYTNIDTVELYKPNDKGSGN